MKIKTEAAAAAVCVPVLNCSWVDRIYPVLTFKRLTAEFRSSLMSPVPFVRDQRSDSRKPVDIPLEDGSILVLDSD